MVCNDVKTRLDLRDGSLIFRVTQSRNHVIACFFREHLFPGFSVKYSLVSYSLHTPDQQHHTAVVSQLHSLASYLTDKPDIDLLLMAIYGK
jgi:hypothetical protein